VQAEAAVAAEQQCRQAMHVGRDHAAQLHGRQFLLVFEHRGVAHHELQDTVVFRNRPRDQGIDIGNMRRHQVSAEPQVDHARRGQSGEGRFGAIGRQHGFTFVDHRNAAVLADLANAALHHHEDDVVVIEQRRRMPIAHRRQRSARMAKLGSDRSVKSIASGWPSSGSISM
jgi:hypothetical protein